MFFFVLLPKVDPRRIALPRVGTHSMHFGCVDFVLHKYAFSLGNMYISWDILYLMNEALIRYLHVIMVRNHAGKPSAAGSHWKCRATILHFISACVTFIYVCGTKILTWRVFYKTLNFLFSVWWMFTPRNLIVWKI